MNYIAFIPARCGSVSIKFKNIKNFCGKPLIYWTVKALTQSSKIAQIHIATDCEQIKETVQAFGFDKVKIFNRSEKNAQSNSSTESVMLEFLERNPQDENTNFLLVQATSPLLTATDIDGVIDLYEKSDYDSILTCVKTKRFFWDENFHPINYDYRHRPRRQDFEGIYMENGAAYLNRVGNILKDKNRLSAKVGIYEMPFYTDIELDEEDDWEIAEKAMKKYILGQQV